MHAKPSREGENHTPSINRGFSNERNPPAGIYIVNALEGNSVSEPSSGVVHTDESNFQTPSRVK